MRRRMPYGELAPHGTAARARWHYRQGHKPLRQHCIPCANANNQYYNLMKEKRRKRNMGTVTALGTGDPVPYIRTAAVTVTFSDGRTEAWVLQGDIMKGTIQRKETEAGHSQIAFIFDAPSSMEKL